MTSFDFASWYARQGYAGYLGGQRDCARDLGVTRTHVRRLELGKRKPTETLVKLCQLMETYEPPLPDKWGYGEAVTKDDPQEGYFDCVHGLEMKPGETFRVQQGGAITEYKIVGVGVQTITDPKTGEKRTRATSYRLTKT